MQVKGSQRLHRLPGMVGRYDHVSDEVSGRAGHSRTLGVSRAGWAGVICQCSRCYQSTTLGGPGSGGLLAPPCPRVDTVPAASGPTTPLGVQHPAQLEQHRWPQARWGHGQGWPLLSSHLSLCPAFAEAGDQVGGLWKVGGLTPLSGLSYTISAGTMFTVPVRPSPNCSLGDGLGAGPAHLPLTTVLVCPELCPVLRALPLCSPYLGHSSLASVLLSQAPNQPSPCFGHECSLPVSLALWASQGQVHFTLGVVSSAGGQGHLSQALFRAGLTSDTALCPSISCSPLPGPRFWVGMEKGPFWGSWHYRVWSWGMRRSPKLSIDIRGIT